MRLIDTHAHIDELPYIEQTLERAKTKDLVAIIAVGSSFLANMKVLALAEQYRNYVYPAIGIHPHEAEANLEEALKAIESNAIHCVAIGEIGLDYQYTVNKARQKEVLEVMLDIAKKYDKPVSLHSRRAWDDVLSLVQAHGIKKGVFHWYSGPIKTLQRILDYGYFISATPAVDYSRKHKEAILNTPIEKILLETDTPVKYSGVPSEPSDTARVLEIVAEMKDVPASQLADITTRNASNLFNLSTQDT